jgi:hypothetical protein
MNSNIRIAATVFPRDMVCLRNIRVDTLHKGDIDDDDDDDNNNNYNNNIRKSITLSPGFAHFRLSFDKNTIRTKKNAWCTTLM